jgi:hypothetical protein
MTTTADADRWRNIHQNCADTPGPITSPEQARYVLTLHAGHVDRSRESRAGYE